MMPWLFLVYNYFRTLKAITVHKSGIILSTRMKNLSFNWTDLRSITLAHHHDASKPSLELLLIPASKDHTAVSINLALHSTHIRARSYFLEELERIQLNVEYRSRLPEDEAGELRRF